MLDNWINEPAPNYGIVNISVANMRQLPVHQSELVNQVLLGTVLPVYEEQNDFYYIRNWDGYLGWMNKYALIITDRKSAEKWQQSPRLVVTGNYGLVSESPNQSGEIVSDLVPCAVLKKLAQNGYEAQVELPGGDIGYVNNDLVAEEAALAQVSALPERITALACRFRGIPYLWGGTSTKGFDCSGFVQTVFRLHNVWLPRNASQMARVGEEISMARGFRDLKPADLLFFGKTLQRITHVAIYLGEQQFIHAEGIVKINSLLPGNPRYNAYRHETLLKVMRVLK